MPKKNIEQYEHRKGKRLNNPPVGLVERENDYSDNSKQYSYDPNLDPQLAWAGKRERTSFQVPTLSLHVHERVEPRTIIGNFKKDNSQSKLTSFFKEDSENLELYEAIEFYKHEHNWSNRLIVGDSLLVMNSLLEKEEMGGRVQTIYIDPPYGIKYGSNFQPFINERKVDDKKDEDLTQEPEMIKAFRDTWELGIHSYLSYLRDRLLLSWKLLKDTGSIFVQISDKNIHHVREIMDEIFGPENFVAQISFQTRTTEFTNTIPSLYDYILWYARDINEVKIHQLFRERTPEEIRKVYNYIEEIDGDIRPLSEEENDGASPIPKGSKLLKLAQLEHKDEDRINNVIESERSCVRNGKRYFKHYFEDFKLIKHNNVWNDTVWSTFSKGKVYVVQTNEITIERCVLMTSDPGDIVFDPTCGSGTTAAVSEKWGRKWITCDTSRVSTTIARQRLMTSTFDFFELAHPNEGVDSGFKYETEKHITLSTVSNKEPPQVEVLYDRPLLDKSRIRVTGPFTVEAVPSAVAKPLQDSVNNNEISTSIVREGETQKQEEWRAEILKTGIRGNDGQILKFSRVMPMPSRWIHAIAESFDESGSAINAAISFGPSDAPLDKLHVRNAIQEAQNLVPKPQIIVFASFYFDPEASKTIDEIKWSGVKLLKAFMNADLITDDLKKERSSNESFWLIGQPDIVINRINEGNNNDEFTVSVLGFDYYNVRTGNIESGDKTHIAMWMLDTDYDGESLFPRQVFFPIGMKNGGWEKLGKTLKSDIDQEKFEKYKGTDSIPFTLGENKRVAVKVIDDRGIESIRVMEIDDV